MNGRVYDPLLGRFLSADPNIDGVGDAQGYNRYSYVGNNPLGATDPSGYFSLKEVLPAIIAIVVTVVVLYCTAGAGVGFADAILHATLAHAVLAGAAGGFASGFSGSLLNGGSIGDAFKAGAIGAAVGAATAWAAYGIGQALGADDGTFSQWGERTLAHGTVGGLASEAQGGSFRNGFVSSAASAGIMHIKAVSGFFGSNQGGWMIAARTTAAAAIGGTATALGGGKFANGAITSAFQQLFNAEAAKMSVKRVLIAIDSEFAGDRAYKNPGITTTVEEDYELKERPRLEEKYLGKLKVDITTIDSKGDLDQQLMTARENGIKYDLVIVEGHGGTGYINGVFGRYTNIGTRSGNDSTLNDDLDARIHAIYKDADTYYGACELGHGQTKLDVIKYIYKFMHR